MSLYSNVGLSSEGSDHMATESTKIAVFFSTSLSFEAPHYGTPTNIRMNL